jgi:hypothetical protein
MRNLKVSTSFNLGEQREFNHLRISNLDEFFEDYTNNLEYYKSPFKIFKELEEQVLFKNNPKATVLVDYKENGSIIFDLEEIKEVGDLRVVVYSYRTVIVS